MTSQSSGVIGGVDTHKFTHHASVIDPIGQLLGDREFKADMAGHRALVLWLKSFGPLRAVGVEGTGSYGAALARVMAGEGISVIEINRPNRLARRTNGKSDRLDSEQAARAVLAETSSALPKSKDGAVEVIRMLRTARSTAVKSHTQAFNALHSIVVVAPEPLREELVKLRKKALINRCAGLRPGGDDLAALDGKDLLITGSKTAMRSLAERCIELDRQIKSLGAQILALVERTAPALLALPGVGAEVAAQLLVTAGDNPERIRNERAFAKLCGVAPQPASSGQTSGRHRLSRGGDRAANSALYIVAITRMRHHAPTRAYLERRTAEGLTKREIMRCLKRYIAREVFAALPTPALQMAA